MHKTTEELLLHLLPGTGTVQFLPGPRSRGNNVVMSSDVDKLREALLSRLYSEVGIWLPVADSAVEELVTTIAKSEVVRTFKVSKTQSNQNNQRLLFAEKSGLLEFQCVACRSAVETVRRGPKFDGNRLDDGNESERDD